MKLSVRRTWVEDSGFTGGVEQEWREAGGLRATQRVIFPSQIGG